MTFRRISLVTLALALISGSANAEKVLVPIYCVSAAGANSARWATELTIHNGADEDYFSNIPL